MTGHNQGAAQLVPDLIAQRGATEALALERFLPYRLSIVSQAVSTALSRLYGARFGLTVPQWRVMAVLGRFQPISAQQVCAKTLMDKVAVSRAVSALMGRHLVERQVDPQDRRRAVLRLTRRGAAIHRQITPLALGFERRLLAGLSAAESASLEATLNKLTQQALKV